MKLPAASTFFGLLLSFSVLAGADVKKDCHVGSYRLSDGTTVDVAPSDSNRLRWQTFTGERGQLHPQANGTWTRHDKGSASGQAFNLATRGPEAIALSIRGLSGKYSVLNDAIACVIV